MPAQPMSAAPQAMKLPTSPNIVISVPPTVRPGSPASANLPAARAMLHGHMQEPLRPPLASQQPANEGTKSMQDFVAFVTGGNTGIGKEIVRKLAAAGVRTVMGCQNRDVGEAPVKELQAEGCKVACTYLELCDQSSIASAMGFIASEFGRLDILVNNAAICFNDPTLYGRCEYTPFQKQARITVDTNFFGTLNVIRAALPLLRASPSPRIVTISSSAGRLAILKSQEKVAAFKSPTATSAQLDALMRKFVSDVESGVHTSEGWGHTCYGMSKLGLIAFTRVLAREEPQMMVNCADPGYCATDMNAKMGYDPPEKGARAAAFLALLPSEERISGKIWYDGREAVW